MPWKCSMIVQWCIQCITHLQRNHLRTTRHSCSNSILVSKGCHIKRIGTDAAFGWFANMIEERRAWHLSGLLCMYAQQPNKRWLQRWYRHLMVKKRKKSSYLRHGYEVGMTSFLCLGIWEPLSIGQPSPTPSHLPTGWVRSSYSLYGWVGCGWGAGRAEIWNKMPVLWSTWTIPPFRLAVQYANHYSTASIITCWMIDRWKNKKR